MTLYLESFFSAMRRQNNPEQQRLEQTAKTMTEAEREGLHGPRTLEFFISVNAHEDHVTRPSGAVVKCISNYAGTSIIVSRHQTIK